MRPEHPLVARYLARLEKALSAASHQERDEVLNDIRGHIGDAVAAGSPIEDVLDRLGPADQLAVHTRSHPVLTVATGSTFLAVGAIASWTLYAYLRWVTQTLRRRLPATS